MPTATFPVASAERQYNILCDWYRRQEEIVATRDREAAGVLIAEIKATTGFLGDWADRRSQLLWELDVFAPCPF